MKNVKRILLFALALVALTLVMSLSIFAEEATEPTVYEFNSLNSFMSAYNSAQDGDIIRMTANTEIAQLNGDGRQPSSTSYIAKAITIDLNGYTLTTTSAWSGILIGGGSSMINGTILHKGNTSVFKIANMDRLEDLTLIVESAKSDTGGISMRNIGGAAGYAHINTVKNVKMIGTGNYGIETYGQGDGVDKTKPVIDLIENCEIDSMKYGLDLSCSIGTIKNSIISGSQAGISCKLSNNFVIALNLEGDNEIMGGNCAINLSTYVTITADEYTDLVNTSGGAAFSASTTIINGSALDITGFSNVNGVMTECEHTVVGGSCTERSTCFDCGKVFDYVHNFVEDESKRELPNCTVQGKAYYNCECGATKESFIPRDPDAHEWVITPKAGSCTEDAVDSYNCKYGSCVGEEYTVVTTPAPGHIYNEVVTKPTCTTDGYKTYTCSCGDTYTEAGEAALGHDYVGENVDGKTVYTCTRCGDSYTCEHVWAEIEKSGATCDSAAYVKYECSECDETKTVTDENAPALGHEYNYNTKCCVRNCGHEFNVLEVDNWVDLHKAVNNKTSLEYDVVRLAGPITVGYGIKNNAYDLFIYVKAPIIIDLNGQSITTTGDYDGNAPLMMQNSESCLVNGTINRTGGARQLLRLDSVKLVENVVLNNTSTKAGVTGIIINAGPIGTLRDVTIINANNHGIEAQNNSCVIGLMERVAVTSNGQAMTLAAKINKITDCTFDGKNIGLSITKLIGDLYLENTKVIGGGLAIRIDGVAASEGNTASFSYDSASKISTSGIAFYVSSSVKNNQYCTLGTINSAVALVNGVVYNDLDKAVAALKSSTAEVTTFALINDLVVIEAIVIDKKVNFSLGGGQFMVPKPGYNTGDTLTVAGYSIISETTDAIFSVVEGGTLTLSGDGIVNSVRSNNGTAIAVDGGNVVIDAGSYTNKGAGDIISIISGTVVINKGTFYAYDPTAYAAADTHVLFADNAYTVGAHTWVDATCTTPKTCSACLATEGEALGHNYVAGEPAEDGSITCTCSACGDAYVINNSAVNGEYYMDTEKVVFADGVLTAMGSEFTYTYNVTTGRIDTSNPAIYFSVLNGNIYFKGATELHQHTGEGYIAEKQADGSINYVCPFCGTVMYVINNSAINGEYYLDTDLVVFNNGVLSAMGGEFTYTYNATTGMIDTSNPMIYFVVHNGVIYFKDATPLHQHNEDTLFAEVTDPTCDKEGYTTYICQFCGPLYDADKVPATGHSYVELDRTETEVNYVCTECGDSYSEDIITHTHTEVEIPAVLPLPSNNHTGMTAGVQCADCGEVLVAPEVINVTNTPSWNTFGIDAVELILSNNISLDYKINVASGYAVKYLVFVFEDAEYVVDEYIEIDKYGRYIYNFDGTRPHKINSNISAYVYGETENGYVLDNYDYSVMKYCIASIKENNAAKTTVISDLLYMGAATQKFVAQTNNLPLSDDELVTTIAAALLEADGLVLTPSVFGGTPEGARPTYEDFDTTNAMWQTANVLIGSSTCIEYSFTAANVEGLTIVVEVDGVEKLVLTPEDLSFKGGKYYVTIECISSIQYDCDVKATIMDGDVALGSITYSINDYLSYTCETASGSKLDLAKAVYNFGQSAYELFN